MTAPWSPDRLLDRGWRIVQRHDRRGRRPAMDELLAGDPQARRLYTNYMWMHACLYAEAGSLAAAVGEATESRRRGLRAAPAGGGRALA